MVLTFYFSFNICLESTPNKENRIVNISKGSLKGKWKGMSLKQTAESKKSSLLAHP